MGGVRVGAAEWAGWAVGRVRGMGRAGWMVCAWVGRSGVRVCEEECGMDAGRGAGDQPGQWRSGRDERWVGSRVALGRCCTMGAPARPRTRILAGRMYMQSTWAGTANKTMLNKPC